MLGVESWMSCHRFYSMSIYLDFKSNCLDEVMISASVQFNGLVYLQFLSIAYVFNVLKSLISGLRDVNSFNIWTAGVQSRPDAIVYINSTGT